MGHSIAVCLTLRDGVELGKSGGDLPEEHCYGGEYMSFHDTKLRRVEGLRVMDEG